MNDTQRIIKAQRYQTSHVLHLLIGVILCLLFIPAGLVYLFIFWPLISLSNAIELKALENDQDAPLATVIKLLIGAGALWVIIAAMY